LEAMPIYGIMIELDEYIDAKRSQISWKRMDVSYGNLKDIMLLPKIECLRDLLEDNLI
jgi:hypothetical protein